MRARRRLARPLGAVLAAAIALPGVALIATSASAVVTPTISEVGGYPIDDNAAAPGITSLHIPGGSPGDLLLVSVDTHTVTVSSVTSSNANSWHAVTSIVDPTAPRNLAIWEGTVFAAGADDVNVTYSTPPTSVYTEIDADMLTSTAGSSTTWADVASGSMMIEPPPAAALTWPTLTSGSTATNAYAYWGFGSGKNANVGPLTSGFSGTPIVGLSDNFTILNPTLALSTAYSPSSAESANSPFPGGSNSTAVGVIVSASGTPALPGTPGTPVASNPGNGQADLSWAAPTMGGGGITGYTVTPNPACGGCGGLSSTGTSTTVTGLTNGQAYTFTVTATNPVGTGPASSASNAVTPATTAPGAPTAATATAGNTQATVSWTAPTSNGGSVITSYTVIPNPACGLCSGVTVTGAPPTTSTTVAGLTNGTAYTFTVTATNAVGTGAASSPSNSVTPAVAAPGAPTGVTATAGNTQATVSWTAPSVGTTPTSYTVIPNPACGGCGGLNPAGVSTTVTGLTNGTAYTFTVTSNPGGGTSSASAPVTPMAPSSGGGGGGGTTPTAPVRVAGADRFATAIAASTAEYPTAGSAGAVVLARSDSYPDALVGSPLAKAKNGPLLFAAGGVLTPETKAEIQRVLPAGGTVYILGGTTAVPASVATTLTGLGFAVTRLAGTDRYATALQVAGAIGNPGTVLLATGLNYPDALSAGPAAAHLGGAVLLTAGSTLPTAVQTYLTAHPGTVYAIGGPAAIADPSATPLTGVDRYATAAAVGGLFGSPTQVGVASGFTFPDALTGGAYEAHFGGPLLLTDPANLPGSTSSYLSGAKSSIVTTDIFGGTAAISAAVQTAIGTALGL